MSLRQVVLDTETTGMRIEDNHRIIEIGCIEMIDRKLTGKHFHYYLNPERDIDAGALAVHGLSSEFLKDKPLFSDIVEGFIAFVQDSELIIHNAPFDTAFLNYEFSLASPRWKTITHYCKILDTLTLARQLHVGQRNSLDALCKRYAVDNSKRELHGALLDATLLAHVYLAMTGGQGSFFEDETPRAELATTSARIDSTLVTQHDLPILNADAHELAAHEKYLQMLKDKGKCLWLEYYQDASTGVPETA